MTLLTVAEFREHVTTGLVDAAVQRMLDDAEAAIVAFAGPVASEVEFVSGGSSLISVARPISAVTSIIERDGWTTPTTLAVDDWEQAGRFVLSRLRYGTNDSSHFRGPVRVTYTPVDDTATRKMVQLDLVKLELVFNPALASETVGAWTQTYSGSNRSYDDWRGDALGRLREVAAFAVVGG